MSGTTVARIFNPGKVTWTGSVTSTSFSARFEARLGDTVVLATSLDFPVSNDASLYQEVNVTSSAFTVTGNILSIAGVTFSGLKPSQQYYLGVRPAHSAASQSVTPYAKVETFPPEDQPSSFTFCASAGSKWPGDAGKTYSAIMGAQRTLFMLHLGNLFSSPTLLGNTSPEAYYQEYKSALSIPLTADFLSNVPMYYVYDQHDYGDVNGVATSPSANAALLAYRNLYPFTPLLTVGSRPLAFQAFTVGRIRFIITDLRSQSTGLLANTASRSTMGPTQLQAFQSELAQFARYKMVVWCTTKAWHEPRNDQSDSWAGYSSERTLIANRIAELGVNNLVVLAGGADMLALDNGTNTHFATSPTAAAGMPLMHVGPISYWGSANNALYSGSNYGFAYYPNFQYAALTVNDTPTSTCLHMQGCSLGQCYLSQSICINATHPSIVLAKPSTTSGSPITVPALPAYVWTTIVSFAVITLLVFGLIGRKVVHALRVKYGSPRVKLASYGYGAGSTGRKRGISSGRGSKARKPSPSGFGKGRKAGAGLSASRKGISMKSVRTSGNDHATGTDEARARRKSSRSHSPVMDGVETQLAEYVGGGGDGVFGGAAGGSSAQLGPSSIAATSVISQSSKT